MEEEIEDIVGDVKLTDSQKSVATSFMYSIDFTDSSSEKNNSSGKDTYIIEQDDSDYSDSFPVRKGETVIDLKSNKDANVQCEVPNKISKGASTSVHSCPVDAQETFTQTSKTILELARADDTNQGTLETQTSFVSIEHNQAFEYRVELNGTTHVGHHYETVLTNALEEESSKFEESESETVKSDEISEGSSGGRIIKILDTESKHLILGDHASRYENTSDFEESNYSDVEQDSLMEMKERCATDVCSDTSEVPKSIDNELEDLYNRLTESREMHAQDRFESVKRYRALTPLTEESLKRDSLIDTTDKTHAENTVGDSDSDILLTNFAGGKVKMLPRDQDRGEFKLPPIQNRSCPNSPQLNFLFSVHPTNRLNKAGTLPCLYEASERGIDRWEINNKDLASGESALISGRRAPGSNTGSIHLPPIHIEGYVVNSKITKTVAQVSTVPSTYQTSSETHQDAISIKKHLKELKMKSMNSRTQSMFKMLTDSRSCSPSSVESHEAKFCDVAERGCEALCVELLRRLRSSSWCEVSETLGEIPNALHKFWTVITEQRIADLIRQVSAQVDSPRTQVARVACSTLACILKSTNYTKKPDFNEAVTLLLTKTGSFSRPVRRAANVALDAVVCGVQLSHAVTALCVHGVDHKSPWVRCAAARLLVVACALGGGGRGLLRARPASAAAARKLTLRALAALLDDKNMDARKYAERLYVMLRPLANFEAYYLTDVEVERASLQMKKYDRLLSVSADAR